MLFRSARVSSAAFSSPACPVTTEHSPAGRRPVPNRPPTPVNHLGNNTHVNTARSAKNGLGLQSHQNKRVAAPLPPQKNIPLFLRHINKHARIPYHAPRNLHMTQLRNAILFNVGHTSKLRRRAHTSHDPSSSGHRGGRHEHAHYHLPEQEQVLRQAATLSRMLQQTWSRADSYDVVMLLVAELLEVHADTSIDLGAWPVLLAVVSHLAQDPEGREVLRAAAIEPWFTVISTHRGHRREAIAVVASQRVIETAIGAWWHQIQAPSAADAVGFVI